MPKKCPPGVICIENITIIFLIITLFIISYLFYANLFKQPITNHQKIIIKEENPERIVGNGWGLDNRWGLGNGWGLFTRPNYGYTNLPGDVLMNPYMPPLRDERYLNYQGNIPIINN